MSPTPKYDRPELRPEKSDMTFGKKPQPQPTKPFKEGSGGGNDGK